MVWGEQLALHSLHLYGSSALTFNTMLSECLVEGHRVELSRNHIIQVGLRVPADAHSCVSWLVQVGVGAATSDSLCHAEKLKDCAAIGPCCGQFQTACATSLSVPLMWSVGVFDTVLCRYWQAVVCGCVDGWQGAMCICTTIEHTQHSTACVHTAVHAYTRSWG